MKIAHISDIHLRLKERHAEYKEVFNNLQSNLRFAKVDRIIITGDLVHSKITMSPELIVELRNFISGLARIATVDILPGNHDCNMSNLSRMDALTPVVFGIDNVHYYRETGLYEIENTNLVYGVYSVLDGGTIRLTKKQKDPNKIYIALFHGPVAGCKMDNDYVFSTDSTSINTFENFDYVMLGDMHQHQLLRDDGSAAYAGSLIQQNFGECIDKGFLIWTMREKKPEFIKVHNNYAFYTIYANDDKELPDLDLPSKCRIRVIWSKKSSDISRGEVSRLNSLIYKKYNPMSVQLSFKPIDSENNDGISVEGDLNFNDQNVQTDLLSRWVNANCDCDELSCDEILDIDKQISEEIGMSNFEQFSNSSWNLKRLTIENFMSYKDETIIDFNSLRGIIGVFGDNAVGKSVIIDAVLYALFNKTTRKVKNEDLVNKNGTSNECRVVLDLEIRGIDYRITRWTTRQYAKRTDEFINARTDVELKRKYIGDPDWENLTETQRNETEKIIRSAIGNFDDFLLTTLSTQGDVREFIYQRSAIRSENMMKFLGLDVFNVKYEIGKERFKNIKYERRQFDKDEELNKLDVLKEELKNNEKMIEKLQVNIDDVENQMEEIQNKISSNQEKINTTIGVTKTVEKLTVDLSLVNSDIDKLSQNLSSLRKKSKNLVTKMRDIEENFIIDSDKLLLISSEREECDLLKQNVRQLKSKISEDKRILGIYREEITRENKCPVDYDPKHLTCGYLKGYLKKKEDCASLLREVKQIINESSKIELQITSMNQCYDVLEEQEQIREYMEKGAVRLDELKQKISELKNSIEVKNISKQLLEQQFEIAKNNEDTIILNEKLRGEILDLESKLDDLKKIGKKYSSDFVDSKQEIALLGERINGLEDILIKIEKLDLKYVLYNEYCKAMSRNGIPLTIMCQAIPRINYELNRILGNVVNFGVYLKIENDKNIEIVIRGNGEGDDTRPATMASGMEKLLINFAIRYSLITVSNLNHSSMIMFDEGFGVLDANNIVEMKQFFDNMLDKFKTILIITHIDSMKDIANHSLMVEKIDDNSRISTF